jgi:Ca2+-binding RTX toxin-like protein
MFTRLAAGFKMTSLAAYSQRLRCPVKGENSVSKNIVFIDSRVTDYQTLVAGLSADTVWLVLNANSDGVQQMQAALTGFSALDSIQIVSHGSPGALYLGSTLLGGSNLSAYQQQLASIGGALTSTGDILLYGCNVAQGDAGLQFITSLAHYTGADVAASVDSTGAAALGGDWVLEQTVGSIDVSVLVDSNSVGLLAVNSPPTGSVTISGAATQGHTLTLANTLADLDGLGVLNYLWREDGVAIPGATLNSLALSEAQVGKTITVALSYTDGHGTTESVTSAASSVVVNVNDAPRGNVTISGTPNLGQVLTASNTIADVDGLGAISYRWSAGGVAISGATSNTFILTTDQIGKAVAVTASYTDGHGTLELVNSSMAVVTGGPADDILRVTGSGNILTGGGGVDRFVFTNQFGSADNRFTDLSAGDILQFTAISGITKISQGDGTATALGAIEYVVTGSETVLHLGLNQIAGADATIVLENFTTPSQLVAFGNLLVVADSTVLAGSPLTGTVTGSSQDDLYLGVGLGSAIENFHVTDIGGSDTVIAQNEVVTGGWVSHYSSGITSSTFDFGSGDIRFSSVVDQGLYASAISGGSLTSGAGNTTISVTAVEASRGSFIYAVTGIAGWTLATGAGVDTLDVTVRASRLDTFTTTGISGSQLDFGADNDAVRFDVSNESGSGEPHAVLGARIDLGAGDDLLVANSSGYGIEYCTFVAGSGNDQIAITSNRDSLRYSVIDAGDGNDAVSLLASGPNNAELVNSTVDLGAGDDQLDLRFAIDSTVDGGEGNDVLRLRDVQSSYKLTALADSSVEVTRPDNELFKLTVRNFESIQFGSGHAGPSYTGDPLTGFLVGTAGGNDVYRGSGLSAAIENLVVRDLTGNDRVVAENMTDTGGVSSYRSYGITNSSFTFGDGDISFAARINQGYLATAVSGGKLTMGSGNSYINIQAVEDFPQDRLGFYYSVTGVSNWTLDAGAGNDVLNVVVRGSKTETFSSYGIVSGSIALGEGDDIADVTVINQSGTGESVGIQSVSLFDLGDGNNRATVISTGYGVQYSTLMSGSGSDVVDVTANRDAISYSRISTGEGADTLFAKSAGGNSADLINSTVDLGGGDDYVDVRIVIDSTIDGGAGYDVLRLRDTESSYTINQLPDRSVQITRPQDQFFKLIVRNIEQIIYGSSAVKPYYSGSPLTGFLSGTAAGDDTYYGSGLSAAIENLTVRDADGNDHVIAENLSASGRVESYRSYGIANSSFTFGDGDISFAARINQGYLATAVSGGDLVMGSGDSRVDVFAIEDYPGERLGFYYAVTGVNGLSLDAGAGKDVLNVAVFAHKNEGFASTGINSGLYALGEGNDLVNVSIVNSSGTRESVAISGATVDLGAGDDVMTVFSTGSGITSSTIIGQGGNDFLAVRSVVEALHVATVNLGSGNDKLFLASDATGHSDLANSTVNMGSGDDYVEIRSGSNSTIMGGDGLDTIRLTGLQQNYVLEVLADGSLKVSSVAYQTAALTLSGFENILFGSTTDLGQASIAVHGEAQVYQTLAVAIATPDSEGAASSEMRYQWESSPDGIAWHNVGNNQTYVIREQDQGARLRGTVGYFDLAGHYSVVATPATSQVVAPTQAPPSTLGASNTLESSVYSLPDVTTDASLVSTEYTGVVGNSQNNAIQANAFGNYLNGGEGSDRLLGNAGVDVLIGGAGNDSIDGGAGDDLIIGGSGPGDDTYVGGSGIDTVKYTSATAAITVDLAAGTAFATAGGDAAGIGVDTLSGIENIIAGNFNDTLVGDSLANQIDGQGGDDTLTGGAGNDTLIGGDGIDVAVFLGARHDYTIVWSEALAEFTVISAAEGSDTLLGIETLSFADASYSAAVLQTNTAPTLTTVTTLTGATEDTAYTITWAALAAAANEADAQGGQVSFRVEAVTSGTLSKGSMAVTAGTTQLARDESLNWTPSANANGTLSAFTVRAVDASLSSADAVQVTVNVTAVNDLPMGQVSISGTVSQGQILTAISTLADADGMGTIRYQWKADGSPISGATESTFTLAQAQVSKVITVTANYTDGQGANESKLSSTTVEVLNTNDLPTGSVTVTGTPTQGETLTATNTLADVDGIGTVSYQWKADGTTIEGATGNTLVLAQAQVGKLITVVASYTDGYGTPESVTGSVGKTVDLLAYTWKNHTLLDGVAISGANQTDNTDGSGAAGLTAVVETSVNLTVSRAVPVAEAEVTSSAVNLQDAIAILKMIVGLPVNGANQPVSPYQTFAADFDGNGTVGLTDAIGVLKHVVGLAAPDPTWHFVNEADTSVPSKTTLSPGTPQATVTADLSGTSPVHVGLVGYLSGDVDGSYAGASGALDLDVTQPTYIATLVASHPGLTASQFGW